MIDPTSKPPMMFYFGPWDRPGHFLHDPGGFSNYRAESLIPWKVGELDGGMQPHSASCRRSPYGCNCGSGPEGVALLHHRDGWTALAFWDRSVDKRGACNSTYIAQGDFTFEQMVELAKTRFAYRWNKMNFEVKLAPQDEKSPA
jgi:hypothetical protein